MSVKVTILGKHQRWHNYVLNVPTICMGIPHAIIFLQTGVVQFVVGRVHAQSISKI